MNLEKDIDIGFVGNYVNRKHWLDEIKKHYPNFDINIMLIGNEMVKKINRFKIHFNRNMSNDINYRTFETLGCNTFLLTNYTENLELLFDINKDLVVYNNINDLFDKINYYLSNDKERNEISSNGFNKVKKKHTYLERSKQLINIIKENI
jgi:spore maturation protein CgeB